MKHDLTSVLRDSVAHAVILTGDDRWRVFVYAVSRVGSDMFIQMAATGPRACTVTVRAPAPIGNQATARRVLAAVREWLAADDRRDQVYLETDDDLASLAS
jgi:hypothetical protein